MLKYIWTVTQDLFLTVTFVSLMHALLGRSLGRKGYQANFIGILLGVLASAVFAYFKNTSNRIISSLWNHRIYGMYLFFLSVLPLAIFYCCDLKLTNIFFYSI